MPKNFASLISNINFPEKSTTSTLSSLTAKAVYYRCDNPDFDAYISGKGFQPAQGSFSDISVIAPELGIAADNLSCGYYTAHTLHEYINRSQLNTVIQKVVDIVADSSRVDFTGFDYREN